jgi:hypothetical protein
MALFSGHASRAVASGPDRYDLELYDRKARGDSEHGPDEEEPPELILGAEANRPPTDRQRLRRVAGKCKEVTLPLLTNQRGFKACWRRSGKMPLTDLKTWARGKLSSLRPRRLAAVDTVFPGHGDRRRNTRCRPRGRDRRSCPTGGRCARNRRWWGRSSCFPGSVGHLVFSATARPESAAQHDLALSYSAGPILKFSHVGGLVGREFSSGLSYSRGSTSALPVAPEVCRHRHHPGKRSVPGSRSTKKELLQHGSQHRRDDVVRLAVQDDGACVRKGSRERLRRGGQQRRGRPCRHRERRDGDR